MSRVLGDEEDFSKTFRARLRSPDTQRQALTRARSSRRSASGIDSLVLGAARAFRHSPTKDPDGQLAPVCGMSIMTSPTFPGTEPRGCRVSPCTTAFGRGIDMGFFTESFIDELINGRVSIR